MDLAVYLLIQGWGMVTVMLGLTLGSRMFAREQKGAWEYLATLPSSGLRLVGMKLWPYLVALGSWSLLFVPIRNLVPIAYQNGTPGMADVYQNSLQVFLIALFWLLYSACVSLVRETGSIRRYFMGWYALASSFLFVWLISSLLGPDGGPLVLHRLSLKVLLDPDHYVQTAILAFIGILPWLWACARALQPLSSQSPERFRSLGLKRVFPIYAVLWIWLAVILAGGGLK